MSSLCLLTGTLVLADNVDGEDDLDLIVTTMNGNVFCFSTQSPHHLLEVTLLVLGNYEGSRSIVVSNVYNEPGHKRMQLPTVPVRTTGTVLVEMVDKHRLHFSDEYSVYLPHTLLQAAEMDRGSADAWDVLCF